MDNLLADGAILAGGLFTKASAHRPATEAVRDYAVNTVTDLADLDALADEWRALERAPGSRTTPFQTFAFVRQWARHFSGRDQQIRILTVRSGGRLVLIVPLAVYRTRFGMIAGWMGHPLLQYGDVIADPAFDTGAMLTEAFAQLRKAGDVAALDLRLVREDAACAAWLDANTAVSGEQQYAIGIDLRPFATPDSYAGIRAHRAKRNRKRWRKLSERGEVAFRIVEGGDEAADLVAAGFAMKQDWLNERGALGKALADSDVLECLQTLARDGHAVIGVLEVDGRSVAMEVALRHEGRHCAFLGAFDMDFAKYGPGNVQIEKIIEWCIGRADRIYDLMAPADLHKREIGSIAVGVRNYAAVFSMKGLPAAYWSTKGRGHVKAAFESLPVGLRREIRRRML